MHNRYFDNAASSFPKPIEVVEAISQFVSCGGGTYSRGAYPRVFNATMQVEECRDMILELIGAPQGYLAWSANATDAANILLQSLSKSLDRVLVSPLEHNAIMRVLYGLGIEWDIAPHHSDGRIDVDQLRQLDLEKYSLMIVNQQSNVNGVIQPIEQISEAIGELNLMVDASQSLGSVEMLAESWGVDYLIFTAHKSLFGVTGVGGFYAKDISLLEPVRFGGTGSVVGNSPFQMPDSYPDMFQAGTPNVVGIVGLRAALCAKIEPLHSFECFVEMVAKLSNLDSIELFLAEHWRNPKLQGELFSLRHKSIPSSELANILMSKFGIECRSGIHCAPLAHSSLGTIEGGTVRFSLSKYHTPEDLDYLCSSIISIVQ